jgi:hypothetical protein
MGLGIGGLGSAGEWKAMEATEGRLTASDA